MDYKSIAWGVDGHGNKHFVCEACGARLGFGRYHPFEIRHQCGDGNHKTGPLDPDTDILTDAEILAAALAEDRARKNT